VVVETVHPITVVEQLCDAARLVRYEALKPSIKAFWKGGIFFIEVYQIRRSFRIEFVASLPEVTNGDWVGVFFPRESQNDVSLLISERIPVGERIPLGNPTYIQSQRLINPHSRHIERLVP
jgi:hypothetical protein